jgi:hypothetical protein
MQHRFARASLQIVVIAIDNRIAQASGWNVFLKEVHLPGPAVMLKFLPGIFTSAPEPEGRNERKPETP